MFQIMNSVMLLRKYFSRSIYSSFCIKKSGGVAILEEVYRRFDANSIFICLETSSGGY